MKKVRIFCNSLFLFEIDNANYTVSNNNYLEFLPKDQVFVKCYPIDQPKTSLPFCFLLKQDKNNIICKSCNIKCYNFLDRCDVFVEPFKIYSQNIVDSTTFTIKNTKYSVVCYSDRIKISCTSGEYIFETQIQNCTFDTQNSCINILSTFFNQKSYTRFDTTTKKFCSVIGNKIQIQDDFVTTQQNFDDTLLHTIVNKYKNNPNLNYENCDIYTQNIDVPQNISPNLVPYLFFENIKLKDYQTATTFLCQDLKQTLSPNALKQFFDDINQIEILSFTPLVYTIYGQECAKDYLICMQDDKIKDIESQI